VRRCKLRNISPERLMRPLVALDQHAGIAVAPARRSCKRGISVAA